MVLPHCEVNCWQTTQYFLPQGKKKLFLETNLSSQKQKKIFKPTAQSDNPDVRVFFLLNGNMSIIQSMYLFRSSGGVLWVWSWGVPGVPDAPDHRGTDSRMFRKGADRGCSLPTCPVCYACPHQTWMQRQNTTGGLHLFIHRSWGI